MSRQLSPNGRVYKEMAGDYPRFVMHPDGTLDELTHQERAFLQFFRCLPADLRPEFSRAMTDDGHPIKERLAEFEAKLAPRRHELTGWWAQ